MISVVVLGSQPMHRQYSTHTKFRNVFPNVSVHKELNNAFIFGNCFILSYANTHINNKRKKNYNCGLPWFSILLVPWATWENKYIGGFNFCDVFTAKEKVWSISEDKYQNTPRVRVILLKAVSWTWITFCSGSVSDIDKSLCMKSEYIFFDDFKTTTTKNPRPSNFSREIMCV